MGKVLLFIFDNMTDYEITFIAHLLKADAGKEVITIYYEDKLVKGTSGLLYKPDKLVADVLNDDVEGLIICGGWFGVIREELIELISSITAIEYSRKKDILLYETTEDGAYDIYTHLFGLSKRGKRGLKEL